MQKKNLFLILFYLLIFVTNVTFSEEMPTLGVSTSLTVVIDTVWVLLTGLLVFFMNTGFAMVESGLIRAKNTVNVLAKNFIVFAITSLAYWFIGWGLMFGDGNGFTGLTGLFFVNNGIDEGYSAISWARVPLWAKFFFQLTFAGTAATIVSGAVAERIKFLSFLIFSLLLGILIYPIVGHWIWGGGWLAKIGMFDFAGSTVVHSVGGWSALAGVLLLGPRNGKYKKNGGVNPIPGHNLSLATLGGFILWFGWFGFNPGSTMAVGDGKAIAHIFVTTNISAVMAIISSTITSWILQKKPDLTMIINGALAGLVAITAPCAYVTVNASAIIGIVAGILVVISVITFDRLMIDDPVGALSVHLINGIFGTLCVGLFAKDGITGIATGNGLFYGGGLKLLIAQLTGIFAVGLYSFLIAMLIWFILKASIGIRVNKEEEVLGLDIGEHGQEAYPDFQSFITK
jgi:Amt family ammonium transporter